jgi:predicted LPLAT superfamily acyltransferase
MVDPYRHMVMFGYLLLDRAVMLAGGADRFAVEVQGAEHYHVARAAGRGMLLLTAHFGCAEVTAPALADLPGAPPVNVVMYQDLQAATEMFHVEHRHAFAGVRLISTSDAMDAGLKVMAALKRGETVALRADRALDSRTIETTLLGGPVHLPAGPFVAAVLSGAPVIQVHTVRLGYRRYRVILSPPKTYSGAARSELLADAARDFASTLEPLLAAYPLQWGNFHDVWTS